MNAEVLREAANLIREIAAAASHDHPSPWRHGPTVDPENHGHFVAFGNFDDDFDTTVARVPFDYVGGVAEHIASWHPAVALAVADWLDAEAAYSEEYGRGRHFISDQAEAVATAYLGERPMTYTHDLPPEPQFSPTPADGALSAPNPMPVPPRRSAYATADATGIHLRGDMDLTAEEAVELAAWLTSAVEARSP